MSQMMIYSYGMAEFTAEVLNAVAATVNSVGFDTALKGMFLAASFAAACSYVINKNVATLVKSTILYIFVTTLLIIPKVTVHIKDDISRQDYVVDNVPIGLVLPANLVSSTFFGLTRLIETAFHQKDDISYSKTGYLFASHVVRNASQVKIIDSEFKKSLNSYLEQCVFYDIYLGAYTLEQLFRTDDIWGLVTSNASANRSFMLDNKVIVCREGVKELQSRFDNSAESAINKYAKRIFPTHDFKEPANNKALKDTFLLSVASGYDYLTGLSKDGVEILKQNIMINAIQDAALNNPELGMYSYAVTRSSAQKAFANNTTGLMMARWLPAMVGATETMIYALFILVVLYSLFTNGEKVFFNYLMTMVWVGSWPVVYAILNFGFTWVIKMKSYGSGLSFYDSSALTQTQYDMASLFGYFTILVPYIAWGMMNLAKQGLGSVFTQMSQLVGNSTQSYAMAASGEAVTGSYNLGNTSFNNHSMHNTNGFKHDTNMNYGNGVMSTMLPGGSTVSRTVDGTDVVNMQSGISKLNTSLHYAERQSSVATEQADNALSASKTDQQVYAENMSSAMRNLYDVGHFISKDSNNSEHYGITASSGHAEAAANYASYIDRYSQNTGKSIDESIRDNLGRFVNATATAGIDSKTNAAGMVAGLITGASASANLSGGIKRDIDSSIAKSTSNAHQQGQEFQYNDNYNDTFESAIRAVKEQGFRATTSDGQKILDSLSASFDKSIQASNSYSAHVQESNSFRELATYSKDASASLNYDASQEFIEYIASKPLTLGQGAMGVHQAESLLKNNPELRASYSEQFINEKLTQNIQKWRAERLDKSEVNYSSDRYKAEITHMNKSGDNYENNLHEIKQSSIESGLDKLKVNDSLINETNKLLNVHGQKSQRLAEVMNKKASILHKAMETSDES